ncbi:MAG: SH3 domain-containing protein [Hyphomicrobiaceae bacterium]
MKRIFALAVATGMAAVSPMGSVRAQSSGDAVVKTLTQPRFLSLKSDKVNVRSGPGLQYPIAWVFRRIGMPVEVLREFENWRQIRDSDGALGWVYRGLLAGRRTALIVPWQAADKDATAIAIQVRANLGSGVVAFAEPGTIANVRQCDGQWCRVIVEPYEGWIEQAKLWGVYENERFKP